MFYRLINKNCKGVFLFTLCGTNVRVLKSVNYHTAESMVLSRQHLCFAHFLNLFLSELNHWLGDSALALSDFMLPAMDGDNWSKVTLRPLGRRKSL